MALIGGNLIVYLTTDTRQFEAGMSKATGFIEGVQSAAKVAAGILMRDLARGLTQGAVTALKMGAQIETLRKSFEALSAAAAGYVPSLDRLREATQGMVSDTDLLLRANEALALGIPTEHLDELFDAAIRLGKAMGLDATQGIQALTIGVGRQSRLVLDNLGIIVKAEEAYTEYAKRIGKTSETLTENERRLGFQTIALEKITEKAAVLGDNISDTEKYMSQWNATIKNATTSLGELLQPLGALAPALEALGPSISILAMTLLPKLSAATLGYLGVAIAAVAGIAILISAYQDYQRRTDAVIIAQDKLEASTRRMIVASQELEVADESLKTALEAESFAYDAVNTAIDQRISATERLETAEMELLSAEQALGIAQQDLASFLSFLSGDVEEYVAVTADMIFATVAAQTQFSALSAELQGMQTEIDMVSAAYASMQGELMGMSDEEAALRLELLKINDAYRDGTIKKKAYERQSSKVKSRLRDLNIEQAELRITMRDSKRALDEQTSALEEAQENLDTLTDKNKTVVTTQEEVDASLADVESAMEDEQKAIEAVVEAQGNLASVHSTVVEAQDTLIDSNRQLEISINSVEAATKSLMDAEAERYRRRLEREGAVPPTMVPPGGVGDGGRDGDGYRDDFDRGGAQPTAIDASSISTSTVSINVSMAAPGTSDEARGLAQEFADEAVVELRRRGAIQ